MGRSQVLGAAWGTALGSFLVLCASMVSSASFLNRVYVAIFRRLENRVLSGLA